MSLEFIGYIGTRKFSETHPAEGPVLDRNWVETVAKAHEDGGFDRALVAFHSTSPESILVAGHAASVTRRLGMMIAHRPGFTAPTLAARQFATLDQFTGGRIAVHIITGGSDAEQRQDGDFLTHDERYARTDEYLEVMRRIWTSETPFDHEGQVYFGGSSNAAIAVAGKHADIYALWGETHAQVRETIARVRTSAAKHGREVRLSLSLRPILADTEEKAWARADAILERVKEIRARNQLGMTHMAGLSVGSQRLLAAAAQGSRLDKRLWTAVAEATGARGNTTALVGTPEQVAEALIDYYDLGITTFLIRGFDPLEDAIEYGRSLLPLTRRLVAERIRNAATAAE
jgi:alkanesulfonate monooxygenase